LGLLATSHLHFLFLRLEVTNVWILVPIKRGREGSDLRNPDVKLVELH
jgi:hypothetical protein